MSEPDGHPEMWANITSPEYLDHIEREMSGPVYAVRTFLPSLNEVCEGAGGGLGLARKWLIVVAGNPGFGKTLTALHFMRDAIASGEKAAFVSLEMSDTELATRFYAMSTGRSTKGLSPGRFDPEVMANIRASIRTMFPGEGPLVNREPLFTLRDVLAEMCMLSDRGVTAFFVDYLQLVGLGDEESIQRQVSEAITHFKAFCKKRKALVVVLSQFNRQTAGNYEDTPRVQGCHGGMMIESTADLVLVLDHSRYERDETHRHIARTWIVLDKNRHGDRREIPIEWDFRSLSAREAMPDEIRFWPGGDR